jgi:predicted dinucleotide-utilizing enzyme
VGSATNATNIAITDDTSTNATMYPVWVTTNTGNLPAKVTSTKLSFNPSTGVLTVTGGLSGGTF